MRGHVKRANHVQQTCETVWNSLTHPYSLYVAKFTVEFGRPCWHLLLKLQLLLLLHSLTEISRKEIWSWSVDPLSISILLADPKRCKVWVTLSKVVFCIDLHCFLRFMSFHCCLGTVFVFLQEHLRHLRHLMTSQALCISLCISLLLHLLFASVFLFANLPPLPATRRSTLVQPGSFDLSFDAHHQGHRQVVKSGKGW